MLTSGLATRFLIGFGLTFAASAAPVLVTELAYPSQRAQATSLYNALWYVVRYRHASCTGSDALPTGSWEALCEQ